MRLSLKIYFLVCAVTKRFVGRPTAAAECRYFVFLGHCSLRIFHAHIAIHHQWAVDRSLYHRFGVNLHIALGLARIHKIAECTGRAFIHLADNFFCCGVLWGYPRQLLRVENFSEAIETISGVDTQCWFPHDGDFSVGVFFCDVFHVLTSSPLPLSCLPAEAVSAQTGRARLGCLKIS